MTGDPAYFRATLADQFVDRLKVALWVYDFDDKRIAWANQAALEAWQAETLEALQDRDLGADMSRSVEQRLNQYREDFVAHGATFSELWTLYPYGTPVTMQVIFRGLRLPDKRMAMLCEGHEAESIEAETLRNADALLHTSVMISLFRADGEQLYRNPAARITYGGASTSFKEQCADNVESTTIERELDANGVARRIVRMKTSVGLRWHEITMRKCKDVITGEDSFLVSEIDISDMKKAEKRLHDFASVSSDWFWEMDSDLRFSYFSDRARDFPDLDITALIGKKRSDFMRAMDGKWQAHLDDLDNRRAFRDFRYALPGVDGRTSYMSTSGVPVFDSLGRFTGYRGTGTNITEQVEAEQKVAQQRDLEAALAKEREINGLQRQFVSMVSHEFRTPLAIIDGSAQRLVRRLDTLTPERAGEALHKIRRSVARLTELMESVLNAARLEEGRIVYAPEPCNLIDIIREICDSYSEVYPDHAIEMDVDSLPAQVVADPKLIRQVISNLTSNAVKYSSAGTTIRIRGREDTASGDAVVSVQDEGVGIPEAEIDQLCSRFFRASTSTGIAGSGIGLHLVQHFIAMHGGRMDVASTEGEGSTFTVRLPGKPPDQGAGASGNRTAQMQDSITSPDRMH